jgi:hypothetical protein
MSEDVIELEVLEDGTISISTGGISRQNHVSADELLEEIARLAGGPVDVKSRSKLGHVHEHGHHEHHHHH